MGDGSSDCECIIRNDELNINKRIETMNFRVYLRALEPEDYLVTSEWRKDDEISHMVGGPKYFVSKEKERQWVLNTIQDNSRIVLGICLKENDKLIGTINIQEIDWINRTGHVPVLIGDKSEWGKGYATEARMLGLKFAFDERGLHRVWGLILEDNIGSLRMHEKCGFVKEGVMRDSVFKGGRYHNQVVVSVLEDEFRKAYDAYCEKHGINDK
jgi:RimJ/RimL family protein N-acetyltransferase